MSEATCKTCPWFQLTLSVVHGVCGNVNSIYHLAQQMSYDTCSQHPDRKAAS